MVHLATSPCVEGSEAAEGGRANGGSGWGVSRITRSCRWCSPGPKTPDRLWSPPIQALNGTGPIACICTQYALVIVESGNRGTR